LLSGLAEIAARIGFSSQAHLSTAFARKVGTTPARYRAAFRADADDRVHGPSTAAVAMGRSAPFGSAS
jgi:AraC-like DNA-binding protein